jgi:APA family basic amino acid/polyamine antiporter
MTDATTPTAPPKPHDRGFGQATATFVVVSSMIGTGVLTTSGFTIYFVDSNQLMLILWVIGGVVAVCGALALAELSAMMPKTGGDYVFLTEAYGPLAGFLSGWVSFLIGFGGPIALSATAAARYVLVPVGLPASTLAIAQPALATAAVVALALVHASGRSRTIQVQGGMTIVKLAILTALAAAGIAAGWGHWSNLDDRPPMTGTLAWAMASSFVYISYAYTGWNGASYLAGEIDDPQRRLPRAILLGTGIVMVLYLALNLAYALALTVPDVRWIVNNPWNKRGLAEIEPIAQIAADKLYGPRVSGPLSVAIGLTLLASVSAYVLAGPRVAYAMARAGQFPAIAGRLSPRWGTPVMATALQSAWAIVLIWSGTLERILTYAGLGLAIFSMVTVAAVYVLRWRRPDLPRPFRTPGYPVVPAIYLLGTAVLVVAVVRDRPDVSAYSIGSILAGVPVYYLWRRFA